MNRNRCPRSPWSVTAFSRKQLLEPNVAEEVPFPHAVCCFPSVLAFSVSVFFLCSLTSSWLLTLFLLERHTYLFLNHICSNAAVSKVRSVCQGSVMTACSHFQFPEDVPSSLSGFYVSWSMLTDIFVDSRNVDSVLGFGNEFHIERDPRFSSVDLSGWVHANPTSPSTA